MNNKKPTTSITSSRLSRMAAAGVLATCGFLGSAPAAQAVPIGHTPVQTDMGRLQGQGYKCDRIGIGGYYCSKPGAPAHYCDNAGKCESVKVVSPQPPVVTATPVPPWPVTLTGPTP